jgi:osmotically-inducible protein OsmY
MAGTTDKRWKHPGKTASDYTKETSFDHDRRTYSTMGNFGKGPKRIRSDNQIHDEVCEILFWHPDVDASDIEVEVKDNFVYLEGKVDSRHAKKVAEKVIENVSGVFDIFNRLTIKPTLDLDSDKIISRGDEGLFTQETIQR